ncbi:MAG: Zn-dependent hydrolase [Lentimicrobiaceae bacterium]|nr:Zn-dependent hydrolase [Lentimicrobiaceae bacterium]
MATFLMSTAMMSCSQPETNEEEMENKLPGSVPVAESYVAASDVDVAHRLEIYAPVTLTADISHLSDSEKNMLPLLFEAAALMDDIFWQQTIGNKDAFLSRIGDESVRRFAEINYGPWDRLNGNKSFIEGVGAKPLGANFYPTDMDKSEFEALDNPDKKSLYTLIRRDENGALRVVWYHDAYATKVQKAAELLREAAKLADNESLKKYLELRAEALLTDNFQESDFAWMDMKDANLDVVIGPIENYEDALYGYKAANEAFILIKDVEWSQRLSHFAALLPELQKGLPVDEKYKAEVPGSDADLNAYDVVYYAGDCNAGSKTIAINLPNDEQVQLKKGSRKLQLKNAMKAKFDKILMPISGQLIDASQQKYVKFDAFFSNTMFHEVAHGLGIKNTLNGKGTVRNALKEQYSALEEAKADILGLYLVTRLYEMNELTDGEVMDNYVTFMAGIFRSVRFGAASAHGKANMLTFAHFTEKQAFTKNADGTYLVNFDNMKLAVESLANQILTLQGDGDYESVKQLISMKSVIPPALQADLGRLKEANIPVDIVFEQGKSKLGL